jgi:hypothetical protein
MAMATIALRRPGPGHNGDGEQDVGKRHQDIGQPHHGVFDPAGVEAAEDSQGHADQHRGSRGGHARQQRHARAPHQARQQVAAELVGP